MPTMNALESEGAAPAGWAPFYAELARKIAPFRKRQAELIAFLDELRKAGTKVVPLNDRDATGAVFMFREIDPFTFFASFTRGIKLEHRLAALRAAKERFAVAASLPQNFDGIPLANNQRTWFVAYARDRKPDDVERLWDVFERALGPDPLNDPEFATAFDRALDVKGVNTNLTMGLFWIRADTFASLDSTMRAYAEIKLPPSGLSFAAYRSINEALKAKATTGLIALSEAAWVAAQQSSEASAAQPNSVPSATASSPSSPAVPADADRDYWFVTSEWEDRTPADQLERFLTEGVWQNYFDDGFTDLVKAMKVGDRIYVRTQTFPRAGLPFDARGRKVSCMRVRAAGTVLKNAGDGKTVEVEWDDGFEPRDWYFFNKNHWVWRLARNGPLGPFASRLIDFCERGVPQDLAYFSEMWFGSNPGVPELREERQEAALSYGVGDVLEDGVFMSEAEVRAALERLLRKKNLILQGAPGVGKSFVARKLAYALMGSRADDRIVAVQFHPSYAYEDFVRGYRPAGASGAFELRDGPLLRLCARAARDAEHKYVLLVDEINRGNLGQILGEMLLLLEADKRGAAHAVTPLYPRGETDTLSVPPNLYVIGTMNIADRSLAVVDFALRRRFAFVSLEPRFGDPRFRKWLEARRMPPSLVDRIVGRIEELNAEIAADTRLGPAFRVGHSFFCPSGSDDFSGLGTDWYEAVVKTEIAPLLEEYWYDDAERARTATERLLLG